MRLMAATRNDEPGIYRLEGDEAAHLTAADASLGVDLSVLAAAGDAGLAQVEAAAATAPRVPVSELVPAIPFPRPGKIICLGLNYADHAKEGGHEVPDYPALFMRGPTSLVAAEAPLVRPTCSERLDYEVELMVVVGKTARHVKAADATDYIFGYTIFNDGSVRDYQRKTAQWTPGKNFDSTGPIGPVVVTPDELPPAASGLRLQTRLNGEVMQDANTADMIFKIPETIEILSEFCTLEPGDLIATGTPEGVGHARRPPVWMKPGDTVEMEIEGIGILRNPIVAE